jgi:hypothetical protein
MLCAVAAVCGACRFPALRSIVVCFLEAVPLLVSVAAMLLFFLFIFAGMYYMTALEGQQRAAFLFVVHYQHSRHCCNPQACHHAHGACRCQTYDDPIVRVPSSTPV